MNPRAILLVIILPAIAATGAEKDRVLVVYNPRLEGSEEIAEFYAKKRGLSKDQLFGLECSPNESVPREEFRDTIQRPLIDHLVEEGWWRITRKNGNWEVTQSRLDYLVLCHGIPLKIMEQPPEQMTETVPPGARPELVVNRAGVDSELALLPNPKAPISGFLTNPLFGKPDFPQDWNRHMVLVTRLDGPNPQAAKRLVESAIRGETDGIWGRAVIDQRGLQEGAYAIGDKWLQDLSGTLESSGWNPFIDRAEATIADPAPFESCAIYAGWYAGDITGPPAPRDFRFKPGAVAYHIHSFSAASLRTFDQHWAGPLVARGVAATLGCVDEPYLQFSPHADRFFKSLFFGKNFAEAAYLSIPALSWQITIIGDPLYRPFVRSIDANLARLRETGDANIPWAVLRKANQLAAAGLADSAIQQLEAEAAISPNPLYFERLAQLQSAKKNSAEAVEFWVKAMESAQNSIQKASYLLALAEEEWNSGNATAAVRHWKQFLELYPKHPLHYLTCSEARRKTTIKGMKKDAAYFDAIIAPLEQAPK